MTKSIMDFVAEAKAMVPSISPEELKSILGQDNVLVVDVRDAPELTDTGKVQGALNVSRGMLEFRADDAAERSAGKAKGGAVKKLIAIILIKACNPIILWCFGWESRRFGRHLIHPVKWRDPETDIWWIPSQAIEICEDRLRTK